MTNPELKWKHFAPKIILRCLRWYMSYTNLSDMLHELGISVNHSTIYRWSIERASALRKKLRRCQFIRADSSWQVDETYVKVKSEVALSARRDTGLLFLS